MGKGSRSRINRSDEVIKAGGAKKKTDSTKKTTIIVAVLVAVFVAILIAAIVFNNTGVLVRARIVAKSDNYKVTGTMASYFFNAQYQSFLNQLGSYASYFGLDTGKSLRSQKCTMYEGADTWWDYFMNGTKEQIKEILALCETAKAEGISLDDKDKENIDEALKAMNETAVSNGYTISGFLAALYGQGVSVNDVRKCLELAELGSKYLESLRETVKNGVTDDDINAYVDKNPGTFLTADTLQYALTATKTVAGAEATEEENQAYETAKTEKKALAEALKAAATDADAFKKWVGEQLADEEEIGTDFDSFYSDESEELSDAEKPTDEVLADAKAKIIEYVVKSLKGEEAAAPEYGDAAYAHAFEHTAERLYSQYVTTGRDGVAKDGVTYADPEGESTSDLDKWLFAKDRKAGDVEVISVEGDTSSTYTVVFVTAPAKKDTTVTKNVAHILISATTAGYDDDDTAQSKKASAKAKAEADKLLAEYKNGEQTLDAFKKLGEEHTEDGNVVYENVNKGDMVTAFNDWIFDEARKEGDTDIVETEYGWHIMYFIGNGEEAWRADAIDGVVSDKLEDWYDEKAEAYHVAFNESAVARVG